MADEKHTSEKYTLPGRVHYENLVLYSQKFYTHAVYVYSLYNLSKKLRYSDKMGQAEKGRNREDLDRMSKYYQKIRMQFKYKSRIGDYKQ